MTKLMINVAKQAKINTGTITLYLKELAKSEMSVWFSILSFESFMLNCGFCWGISHFLSNWKFTQKCSGFEWIIFLRKHLDIGLIYVMIYTQCWIYESLCQWQVVDEDWCVFVLVLQTHKVAVTGQIRLESKRRGMNAYAIFENCAWSTKQWGSCPPKNPDP